MSIKSTAKGLENLLDRAKKGLVKSLSPIGPTKLIIYGALLGSEAWYLRGKELLQKDWTGTIGYYAATAPLTTTAEIFLVTGFFMATGKGVDYVKKTVKNMQKAQRARRLYAAWKSYSPSYQPILE